MTIRKKPKCLEKKIIARSRLFTIESVSLAFENGEARIYERLVRSNAKAVLMVPIDENGLVLMVREYACGSDSYELGFPKGLLEPGEDIYEAANRELKEEVGFGAATFEPLKPLSSSPNYFGLKVDIVIARDLYPCSLQGDEPEPLEVFRFSFDDIDDLLAREDFSEARSIAALFMVKQHLLRGK